MHVDIYLSDFVKQFNGHVTYLGDGAYAGWNGFAYVIYATDGLVVQHQVHLGDREMWALNLFVKKIVDYQREQESE